MNACANPRPCNVILYLFGSDSFSMAKRIVERSAARYPAPRRMAKTISAAVDFPFVPVIPITTSRLAGNPYESAIKKARAR